MKWSGIRLPSGDWESPWVDVMASAGHWGKLECVGELGWRDVSDGRVEPHGVVVGELVCAEELIFSFGVYPDFKSFVASKGRCCRLLRQSRRLCCAPVFRPFGDLTPQIALQLWTYNIHGKVLLIAFAPTHAEGNSRFPIFNQLQN